jgi:hypothetical protein
MSCRLKLFRLFVMLAVVPAGAQDPLPDHPAVATIRFECFWEPATPQDYVITVQAPGRARYLSRNPTRPNEPEGQGPDPDFQIEFTLSPGNQARILRLAEQANFFNGNFDYTKHRVASTGTKTLAYADPVRHFETKYDWSENQAIDQLTQLFQGISSSIEHGRKLQFLRRFDKLGLEAELKSMEDEARRHYLAEMQVIAPTLASIANDSSVLNIARQRARRLLALAGKENGQSAGVKMPQ